MTTPFPISDTLLEQLISSERFAPYVRAAGGDRDRAVRLYQWNGRVSGAFYEVLQYVEVFLRNAIHHRLEALHATVPGRPAGAAWFDDPGWAAHHWFHTEASEARDKAVAAAGHTMARPRPGKVVAELPFGFWRYLLTARYEQSFWVPALDAGFPSLPAGSPDVRRHQVEHHVAFIHLLRNRIAHHEPIHGTIAYRQKGGPKERYDLGALQRVALELVSWMSPDAANWLAADISRIDQLLTSRP